MKKTGVYIHIPFCAEKCPYCDFFSVKSTEKEIDRYVSALINKIESWGERIRRKADTLYFGGGTPSCMGAERLVSVANSAKLSFCLENAEITAEVNPSKNDFDFYTLRKNGFNRISLGLQSANDNELKMLGRIHTVQQVEHCLKNAKNAGFDNISLDLMLAIPLQTKESLERSIEFCAKQDVQHISAYMLKIENGTPFAGKKDLLDLPDDDEQAEMYLFACEKLNEYGYHQYEISNFSKKGFESRHNLKYWNDDEYIGIGPSAHSFINGKRFYFPRSFDDFFNGVVIDDGSGGYEEEYVMLRLRLSDGINNREYKERFGRDIPQKYFLKAKKFEGTGYIITDNESIKLTSKGFIVSNAIISEILC